MSQDEEDVNIKYLIYLTFFGSYTGPDVPRAVQIFFFQL